MGFAYTRIAVDGTVLYCCNTEIEVGRVGEGSLAEQWYGPRWQDMRERIAPRFLGKLTRSEANQHGGKTITYDGSNPGLLATVTLVLGADGKPVASPVVQLMDVVEAR